MYIIIGENFMEIIRSAISKQEMIDRYTTSYPKLVKAVVDCSRHVIALDAEWHADLEVLLLEDGALQEDLWGINLMPFAQPQDFIVYESLINIRPAQKNFSLEINDTGLRSQIRQIVSTLIDFDREYDLREPSVTYEPGIPASLLSGFGSPTKYPCFKHHKQLTMEKWRSFEAYKRVLMIANEFGRAKSLIPNSHTADIMDCYERAMELFHITIEAARLENLTPQLIDGLLRLRERTAKLYAEQKLDIQENSNIRDALIALEPDAYRLLHPDAAEAV